ncbi:MAG TPA: O-sialoglycoprotein endopeptidase [Clostridiales bacterium]|nr:O-sialoglycoprotein endopeptidase [Clostridiales bacterium]
MKFILGIDTSCYTTSLAGVSLNGDVIFNKQLLLDVPLGERGLQQSDALFRHIKNLPAATVAVRESLNCSELAAVCASVRPRPQNDSYMPVFLFSHHIGQAISDIAQVPFFATSHQENHIMAGLYSANGPASSEFLALHLSGGTSEMLHVKPLSNGFSIDLIGRTTDLSAGQLVDRIGVAMGLPFPAGPHLESLSASGTGLITLSGSVKGLNVSFSGPESQGQRYIQDNVPHSEVAKAVFDLLERTISKWILNAVEMGYPKDVLLVGGVSSSQVLRTGLVQRLQRRNKQIKLYFADADLSRDNAVGTALIGLQAYHNLQR